MLSEIDVYKDEALPGINVFENVSSVLLTASEDDESEQVMKEPRKPFKTAFRNASLPE